MVVLEFRCCVQRFFSPRRVTSRCRPSQWGHGPIVSGHVWTGVLVFRPFGRNVSKCCIHSSSLFNLLFLSVCRSNSGMPTLNPTVG